jgi:hypothetical protein
VTARSDREVKEGSSAEILLENYCARWRDKNVAGSVAGAMLMAHGMRSLSQAGAYSVQSMLVGGAMLLQRRDGAHDRGR